MALSHLLIRGVQCQSLNPLFCKSCSDQSPDKSDTVVYWLDNKNRIIWTKWERPGRAYSLCETYRFYENGEKHEQKKFKRPQGTKIMCVFYLLEWAYTLFQNFHQFGLWGSVVSSHLYLQDISTWLLSHVSCGTKVHN